MSIFVPPIDIGARQTMVMECDVQQNTETGSDGFGQPLPAVWSTVRQVRCFVWSKSRTFALDEKRTAMVEEIHAVFPRYAVVVEADRLGDVRDRYGAVRFAGPLEIRTLQKRDTHLECVLRKIE